MSIISVRPYFRDRLEALGYEEWTESFSVDNIPQTILEKVYHIESVGITSSAANQLTHQFIYTMKVRLFVRGFRDESDALDSCDGIIEDVLSEILSPANRISLPIKDIQPGNIQHIAIDESNDSDIIIEMDFNAIVLCKFV
jgi:hypothetical protein